MMRPTVFRHSLRSKMNQVTTNEKNNLLYSYVRVGTSIFSINRKRDEYARKEELLCRMYEYILYILVGRYGRKNKNNKNEKKNFRRGLLLVIFFYLGSEWPSKPITLGRTERYAAPMKRTLF